MHIAIEGLDGVGKTTTAQILAKMLNGVYCSKAFHQMKYPKGNFDNFTTIKELFSYPDTVAAFDYGLRSLFLYSKYMNYDVVTERYFATNYAVNPTQETLNKINMTIEYLGVPDLTVILYCDYEVNYQRMYARNPKDKDFYKLENHEEFYNNLLSCVRVLNLPHYLLDTTRMTLDEVCGHLKELAEAKRIKKIDLPQSNLLSIERESQIDFFCNHESLFNATEIYFGENITKIPPRFFEKFPSVEKFLVDEKNPSFSALEGVLFDKSLKILLKMPPCYGEKNYMVPDTVKYISYNAFKDSQLNSVRFNDSCTEAGCVSFFNCRNMISIRFGRSLSKIGKNAFVGCSSLKNIETCGGHFNFDAEGLHNSNNELIAALGLKIEKISSPIIGAWAFAGNNSIKCIECADTVKQIRAYAFADSSLESITINSYVEIHEYAFWNCFNLVSIIFNCADLPNAARELFCGITHKVNIIVPRGCGKNFSEAFANNSKNIVVIEGEV